MLTVNHTPHPIDPVVSTRLPADVRANLQALADRRGTKVGTELRRAAIAFTEGRESAPDASLDAVLVALAQLRADFARLQHDVAPYAETIRAQLTA